MIVEGTQRKSSRLTLRESEILAEVAQGRSAKQIAYQVNLAPRTVERYIENLRYKLGAKNRTHLVTLAVASGDLVIKEESPAN